MQSNIVGPVSGDLVVKILIGLALVGVGIYAVNRAAGGIQAAVSGVGDWFGGLGERFDAYKAKDAASHWKLRSESVEQAQLPPSLSFERHGVYRTPDFNPGGELPPFLGA